MQSGIVVSAKGNKITQPGFDGSWHKLNIPTTIIAGLLKNKHSAFDSFYGNNLEKIAGQNLKALAGSEKNLDCRFQKMAKM